MAIGHMKTSQKGIDLIKAYEGFRAQYYRAFYTEKYLTIGYGHYGPDVRLGQVITKREAEELLKKDLAKFEANVNKYDYTYDFNQSEFDALVSFAYNICSIDQLTNNGKRSRTEIAEKMLLYVKSGGVTLQGLVRRRKEEQALFLSGKNTKEIRLAKPTLRRRCKSEEVKKLQASMNILFGSGLTEDGSFGPLTKEALCKAQDILSSEIRVLVIDGIYGPKTFEAFKSYAIKKGYQIL